MDDIEKSRHGRYEDNAKNRRLHRVGQEYGSKKQEDETVDPSKLTLDQLHKEINELGHILGGRIKDGRRTEDVEKRISDLLKYAPDKVLESTLEALRTNVKPNPTAKIAAKLTEMEINRRKTEGSAKQTGKKEETPKEEPKASSTQEAMARDCTFAWIDPLTGQQPEVVRITCAPDNKTIKVRKSQKSKSDLRKNILEATKETGRYNFSYGWVSGKDSAGHIITAERHADGNLTFYDPQNGKNVPMIELLDEVSPKYLCRIIRVDNLLIKPNIVKDYAMHYE